MVAQAALAASSLSSSAMVEAASIHSTSTRAVEGLQVECRVEIEALTPRGSPQRHLVPLADPAMDRAGLVLGVHHVGEVDRLVGGQAVQQRLVSRDEGRLPALVGPRRQAFRAPVFETQAMQQLQAAGMAVDDAPPRRDIGGHLATVPAERGPQVSRKLGLLFPAPMPASAMPVERRQLIQATRSVALEPGPYRVVVEVENFRHFDAVQTVVQQKHGIRPPRHTVDLARMTHHRLTGGPFLGVQKSTTNHVLENNPSKHRWPALFRVPGESGYTYDSGQSGRLSGECRVKPVGKPDAGNPHVRFDERGEETE